MEARALAKANQHKSDQIMEDLKKFQERGGTIQVLPTRPNVLSSAPLDSPFVAARKRANALAKTTADDENDAQDDIMPSRETPAEQLDIKAE